MVEHFLVGYLRLQEAFPNTSKTVVLVECDGACLGMQIERSLALRFRDLHESAQERTADPLLAPGR